MPNIRTPAAAPRLANVSVATPVSLNSLCRRWVSIAAVSLALGGCAGDFGRVWSTTVQNDDIHAWMGPMAARPAGLTPPWKHQLTDHERALRDLAFPLIEPPYHRNHWDSALSEYGLTGRPFPYPDRAAYASRLFQTAYRSQTARYNKLMEDIRNDVVRLDPFFSVARTVADMDSKRDRAMAYVSNLSAEERTNTVQRMRENAAIVQWVQGSLNERVASYQIALERLVIAAPSPLAVEAERQLTLLRQRIAAYNSA